MTPEEANKELAEKHGANLTRFGQAWDLVAKATAKMSVEEIERLASLACEIEAKKDDIVNHPQHYTQHPSGFECIEVARHFGFNLGNVIKYIWRAPLKGLQVQDLKKARWYLDDEIRRLEKVTG